jgi:hypothetical protein
MMTPKEAACALLKSCLTLEQAMQYEAEGRFRVRGASGDLYEVGHSMPWAGFPSRVAVIRGERLAYWLNFWVDDAVPLEDHFLAQKLFLEGAEIHAQDTACRSY